jgi:hypothetical protein
MLNGALKCFCTRQEGGSSQEKFEYYAKKIYKKKYEYKDLKTQDTVKDVQLCNDYTEADIKSIVFNNSLKFIIIFINTILRMLVIKVIEMIGCSTESTQMIYITDMVFVCQLFNTGFLLMLCNGNLSEQGFPMFNGALTDFNAAWFTSMGETIVGSMKFNAWFPIPFEFGMYMMRVGFRLLDKIGTAEGKTTKKISVQQYVNTYAGPMYFLHFRYSGIMNIIFITMMFGCGIPILFPIAAASLLILYCLENYMIYYVYKIPPAYDEKLNNSVLSNLAKAPLFLLSFGYWMLSSR